jgi:hypothetical protein
MGDLQGSHPRKHADDHVLVYDEVQSGNDSGTTIWQ